MRILPLLLLSTMACAVDVHVGLYGGVKQSTSDLEPVDKQYEYGVVAHVRPPFLPIGLQVNAFQSRSDDSASGTDYELRTSELQIGVGRVFDPLILIHPFIAAGATRAQTDWTTTSASTSSDITDSNWGWWAQGGAYASLGIFEIGVLAGYSQVKADLGAGDVEVGGKRVGLIIGLGF